MLIYANIFTMCEPHNRLLIYHLKQKGADAPVGEQR